MSRSGSVRRSAGVTLRLAIAARLVPIVYVAAAAGWTTVCATRSATVYSITAIALKPLPSLGIAVNRKRPSFWPHCKKPTGIPPRTMIGEQLACRRSIRNQRPAVGGAPAATASRPLRLQYRRVGSIWPRQSNCGSIGSDAIARETTNRCGTRAIGVAVGEGCNALLGVALAVAGSGLSRTGAVAVPLGLGVGLAVALALDDAAARSIAPMASRLGPSQAMEAAVKRPGISLTTTPGPTRCAALKPMARLSPRLATVAKR